MGSFRGLGVIFILGLHFWVSFQSSGPVDGLIRHISKVNYKQCVKECQQMSKCLTATYTRLSGLCRLFEKPYNLPPEFGDTAYTKSVNGNNTTQTTDKQYEADSTCTANSCGEPPKLPATEISGNMVSVGAKVRYRCLDGSKSAISVCLSNGSWSLKSLNCNCSFPPSFDNDTSLNVESWAYRFDNHTHFTAVAHCLSNCSAETKTQATCEIATGEWILPSTICCTSIAKDAPEIYCKEKVTGYFKVPLQCTYYSCFNGISNLMTCPEPLVFNVNTESCDWASNVPDCA